MVLRILSFIAIVILAACQPTVTPIPTAQQKRPVSLPSGQDTRPLELSKVAIRLPSNYQAGWIKYAVFCDMVRPFDVKGGHYEVGDPDFVDKFNDQLRAANYNVVDKTGELFDDGTTSRAELQVGALIQDFKGNFCNHRPGEGYVEVKWQVYDALERRVIYTTTTEGSAKVQKVTFDTWTKLVIAAYGNAVQNLLADRGFLRAVSRGRTAAAPSRPVSSNKAIRVNGRGSFHNPIRTNMRTVRRNVVTVIAPGGHGSGFVVNGEGYILTNQHVVGGADRVKVRFINGQETDGRVVRTSGRRDIALIKTRPLKIRGLPVARSRPVVGDEIYAIGAPLDVNLGQSVSRGTVSAFRTSDGQRYIQSDVNIQQGNSGGPLTDASGNVIGLAVSALAAQTASGAVSQGINFFIPIQDGLRALNVRLAGARSASSNRTASPSSLSGGARSCANPFEAGGC